MRGSGEKKKRGGTQKRQNEDVTNEDESIDLRISISKECRRGSQGAGGSGGGRIFTAHSV